MAFRFQEKNLKDYYKSKKFPEKFFGCSKIDSSIINSSIINYGVIDFAHIQNGDKQLIVLS